MTNSTTTAMHESGNGNGARANKNSDAAPMVITRLSGWIDVGEIKSAPPSWILPTRSFTTTVK